MNNQQAVVDQVVQNLAFDVEAVPKYESIQTNSVSQSTPLNVKIKVRKKDEINMQPDVSSNADNTSRTVQKVRLVNSDRTIMTFDVFMEAEFEKKPSRKLHKHIFDLLRPGICLGAVDDDDCPYMPSTSYSANITEPAVATKSNGTLKQTFTLSKNVIEAYSVSTQPVVQKWLFGNCKPGGCLDPPFSEDKYSYKPSTRQGPEREENFEAEKNKSDAYSNKKPITLHDEETQSNGRHSSVFDSGLFKKKQKSSDKSTNTKLPDKTTSIVDVYQGVSATNSVSTHSNPIITYPPKTKGNPRISDDKTVRSRGPSDEKPRHSFNDHSEPYFIPPKGVQRIKENVALDTNDQPKQRPPDAADLKDLLKESFKVPVPLPIPIPVPIPMHSSKRKPKTATIDDIIKKDSIPDQDKQDQKLLDQELQGTINLKDIKITPLLSRTNSEGRDTNNKPVEHLTTPNLILSNIIKPTAPNEVDGQNLEETKSHSLQAKYNENNMEDSTPQSIKKKTASSKIPVSVPVLLPVNFNDPNHTDTDATDSMTNDNIDDDMKLSHSKKPFEIKAMPSTIKDTPIEGSKDMEQNIKPRLGENKPFSSATPNLKHSNTEIDAIPKNFIRTRDNFFDQESDTKMPIDLDMKRDSNADIDATPEKFLRTRDNFSDQESDTEMPIDLDMKQDSNTEIDAIPENYLRTRRNFSDQKNDTEMPINLDIKRDSKEAEITDEIIKPAEINDTKKDIKRDPEEEKNTDGIENLTKQTDIEDKTLTSTLFLKDDIKKGSEEEKVVEEIEKPSNQKDINNKPAIPTKYTEDDIKPYSEDNKITDGIKKYIRRDSKEETIRDEIEKLTNKKNSQDEPASPTKYTEDIPDVNFRMPNTHQNIDSPKKDERKDSQRILSKLPILQNNTSLQNASKTSVKYKNKKSDSPDFYLDNIEYGDTDLGIHIDEKLLSLPRNPDHETDITDGKISDPYRNKEYVGKTGKPNNDDKVDSNIEIRHASGELTNIIVAHSRETSILGSIKEVSNEKKLGSESMASSSKKFYDDEEAYKSHESVSHELIGTKSVIYNTDGFMPTTSVEKLHGGTALSSVQSANTLKSAMKKDNIFIDFGFHSYLNDKNERIVQTVDSVNAPKRLSSDSVTIIKSQIRISSNELRIPVDSEHDIFLQIKKANANQRVSISESRLENVIDTERPYKQRSPVQYSDVETRSSEVKAEGRKDKIQESATADRFLDYYEQELVPLQLIIKNLREEIDFLATQQSIFKDKLYCTNKSKLPRLVHSNKKCFGCVRK